MKSATGELSTAHVVVVEQAAGGITDGEQTADDIVFRIEHLTARVDERAAEGCRHATLEGNGVERSLDNRTCFGQAVGRRELVTRVVLASLVVFVDDGNELLRIKTGLLGKFFDRIGLENRSLVAGVAFPVVGKLLRAYPGRRS